MIKFVGPSYQLNARKADVQRLVNMHPVVTEAPGGKSFAYLDQTPGLTVFSAAVALGFLLQENGGFLLQESGGNLVLEA